MLRLGLFGAGRIGRMHARNLAANPGVRLVSIYDPDGAAAQAAAKETGAAAVGDPEALLASGVDAVLIASATNTHVDLITLAAQAGKAVLCEKPIDLDIARVETCRKALESAGVPVQIGFNRRFDPGHGGLRSAVEAGEIGNIELAVISSRDPAPPPVEYLKVSGGLFRDMMIHDLDLARFLFGEEPVEISAMGSNLVDPVIGEIGDVDTATVQLKMASGGLCLINCSRRCSYGYDQRVEVFGQGGMLISGNHTATRIERYGKTSTAAGEPLLHFFIERYGESYKRQVDSFVACVAEGRAPSPSFEDGRRALILADAALESLRTGSSVKIAY